MSSSGGPNIINDSSLILCLDAACTDSYPGTGSAWIDLSNNGNSGTLYNSPSFSNDGIGSIVLNGSNQYIDITKPALNIQNDVTYSCWIKSVSNSGQQGIIGDSIGWDRRWSLYLRNVSGQNYGWGANPNIRIGNIKTNLWVNIVGTYSSSNSTVSLYDNASLLGTLSYTTVTPTYGNLYIGYTGALSAPSYFSGNIACVQIYNRALSQTEITQNFNVMRKRFGL